MRSWNSPASARVRPRDVAGVARVLRPGVDQEGFHARRALPVQHLVVQHGRVAVEGDDVVVRQFLLARACGPAVREVDLVLGGARSERLLGGAVGPHAGHRRERHAFDLIRRLDRAGVIEGRRDGRRVVIAEALGGRHGLPQDSPAARTGLPAQLRRGAHDHEVELAHPVALRRGRGQEPIVVRLVENELRAAARPVDDERVRRRVRQPGPVPWVGPERVGGVVEVIIELTSGAYDQSVVTARNQSAIGTRHQGPEVLAVQLVQCLFRHRLNPWDPTGRVTAAKECRKTATFACKCITARIHGRRAAKRRVSGPDRETAL